MTDSLLSGDAIAAAAAEPAPAPVEAVPGAPAPTAVLPSTPIVTIDGSSLQGQVFALATGLARIAGVSLIAHGAMTQAQVNDLTPIVVQLIAGTALAVGGQLVAQAREWLAKQAYVKAALTDPNLVQIK